MTLQVMLWILNCSVSMWLIWALFDSRTEILHLKKINRDLWDSIPYKEYKIKEETND